jgi:hypothetical protein
MREPQAAGKEFALSKEMQHRLKMAVKGVPPPPHLETRIRACIREADSRTAWHPRLMAVAAALVV